MNNYISLKINKNYWLIKKIPIINNYVRLYLYKKNIRNLNILHQILAGTKFANKYWIIGGLLLGWIREKDILIGNENDIDFAFNKMDEQLFLELVPSLIEYGFHPFKKWKNNAGQVTEYVLLKDGCKYEFFLMFEKNNRFRYFGYSKRMNGLKNNPVLEATSEIKKHRLSTMRIFDIPFFVPDNPQDWLSERYGDWKTPNPKYHFIEGELAIIDRVVWKGNNSWRNFSKDFNQ